MTGLLHDLGARIVVLVDPVPKAHEPEGIVLVLGALDELGDAPDRPDFRKHLERGFVGAAVGGPPQAGAACGDTGEWICAGGTRQPHRRGRGVLLVVGVQVTPATAFEGKTAHGNLGWWWLRVRGRHGP